MSRRNPYIGSRPDEAVQFGDDDPASVTVEAELSLDVCRNLDRVRRVRRLTVGDRRDKQLRSAFSHDCGHNHDCGPILASAFLASIGLVRPEIDVGDDLSRLRDP